MKSRTLPSLAAPLLIALLLTGCPDEDPVPGAEDGPDAEASSSLSLMVETQPPAEAPAGEALSLTFQASTPSGPAGGLQLDVTVDRGGGAAPMTVDTDAEGRATLEWTLGVAPVLNRLQVEVGPARAAVEVTATLAEPLTTAPFGDVNGWLESEGLMGSTEDLAFADDALVVGIPGGLLRLDAEGTATRIDLNGAEVMEPLGVAFDHAGNLWVADPGTPGLLKVTPEGEVSVALTDDGEGNALVGPNYVAVGMDGKVYLSDPCAGVLVRFDQTQDEVDARLPFDVGTQGGPNGFAFDRAGDLWVVTENTVLLCQQTGVAELEAPLATLFRVPVDRDGFGEREVIADALGVFGDGVAFDAEDNLYVIVDRTANLMLAESAVWVRPAEGGDLRKLAVADEGKVYANLAFGNGTFGPTTLYVSLLAVPPFTPRTARGVERVEVGIPGLPLLR